MKISKTKLRQIITEELKNFQEERTPEDDIETLSHIPRATFNPSDFAGPELAYRRLFSAAADLIRAALEEDGLGVNKILDALEEAVVEELGPGPYHG